MKIQRLRELLQLIEQRMILCIGDVMLDRFNYGEVSRISPEAPIPVFRHQKEVRMLGAAGNVARNVSALGGQAGLLSVVGADAAAQELFELIGDLPQLHADLVTDQDRITTTKIRYIAASQQMLRVDQEEVAVPSNRITERLMAAASELIPTADMVLLSDYAKGVLSQKLVQHVISGAKKHGKPVIADPKGRDFSRYTGVSLLKPNASELAEATGMPCDSDKKIEVALAKGLEAWQVEAILVTRSARGMSLAVRGNAIHHSQAKARDIFDVSGAGDTGLAALGLALSTGIETKEAMEFANLASSIAVTKAGTAIVTPQELLSALGESRLTKTAREKILPAAQFYARRKNWEAEGYRVGFTNGCFDILHQGHVSLLEEARDRCDRLIIGLNSDASVKRLKGASRPINLQEQRAAILSGLSSSDAVVIFDEDTPLKLLEKLRPDVLFKGADYKMDDVVGADLVRGYGGDVQLIELVEGQSTTSTIEKMQRLAKT